MKQEVNFSGVDWQARAEVDEAIIKALHPQFYQIINDFVGYAMRGETPPKAAIVTARRFLPKAYSQSFEGKPPT